MRARVVTVDPNRPDEATLSVSAEVLRGGGVICYPTETFYALGADALSSRACERVHEIKGRPADKALPVVVSDDEQLARVAELSGPARRLADGFWPGPLTLVLPARRGIPAASRDGTIAVRVSGLALARALPRALDAPVVSTSANRSGSAPLSRADEVAAELGSDVDLVLDGGASPGGSPSTIVSLSSSGLRLLRAGAVPFELVERAFEE